MPFQIWLQWHCTNAIRFLTNRLRQKNISYTWGFPFKLFVEYKAKKVIIRTVDEARILLGFLEKDWVGQELKEIAKMGDQWKNKIK